MKLSLALMAIWVLSWELSETTAFTTRPTSNGSSLRRSFPTTHTTSATTTTACYSTIQHDVNNVVLRPTTAESLSTSLATSSTSTTTTAASMKDSQDDDTATTATSSSSSSFEDIFDSFQIGSPIVHRYKSISSVLETTIEEDYDGTNYVMWYHGRSIIQDTETNKEENSNDDVLLPPLSTGRIGRAVSRNGLIFQKDTKGATGEDIAGVALGLNNESWWGFDTAHVGLGSVLLPMTTPAVMTEGGIYLMYYFGGNYEETNISLYSNNPAIPSEAKIKGMTMRIGVAVSQDGETWGRVEGDHPTNACMVPYDKSDPSSAMSDNNEQEFDSKNLVEELYCAWPEVVVQIVDESDTANANKRGRFGLGGGSNNNAANTGDEKSGFFMYYSTMTKDTKTKAIAYAVSEDGFRWFKRGLCIQPETTTTIAATDNDNADNDTPFDDDGCARCNVVRNASYNELEETWSDSPGYTMFYEGVWTKDNKHRILSAQSTDGKIWTKNKNEIVLNIGSSESWDCDGVGSPHILRIDDGSQRMYYVGQKGKSTAVGVAKLELGSTNWVKEQSSFVFAEA